MTQKRAAWATGTVSMTGTGECTITVTLTADDSTREVPLPDAARRSVRNGCSFTPKDLRVSADGSTLYVRSFNWLFAFWGVGGGVGMGSGPAR